MMPMMRNQRGFTLIEIMVALSILAISMVAIYKSVAGYVNNAGYLEQRTFAQWAAVNVADEMRLRSPWPDLGKSDGELVGFAGHDWFWHVQVLKNEAAWMRTVEVKVFADEEADNALGQLTFYVVKP